MAARRVREMLIALLAAGVVIAVIAVLLVVLADVGERAPASSQPGPTISPPSTSSKPKPPQRLPAALVVKIDNVPQARPHTGLSRADAIYVEPVEGGFTRLLALYWGSRPPVIGPVRSVRETDVELLAFLKRPVLAYSGAARRLAGVLRAADLVHANPETVPGAFSRSGGKPIPHNMYLDPKRLPKTTPVDSPLKAGRPPGGGRRVTEHRVSYRGATYDFTWSARAKRWLVSMDGSPLISTEYGQLRAGTVVVQRVRIVRGQGVKDPSGSRSPVARTVGSGKAIVLRDGKRYDGTWRRRSAAEPTTYRTGDGKPLPLGRGKVWVLLVPA